MLSENLTFLKGLILHSSTKRGLSLIIIYCLPLRRRLSCTQWFEKKKRAAIEVAQTFAQTFDNDASRLLYVSRRRRVIVINYVNIRGKIA